MTFPLKHILLACLFLLSGLILVLPIVPKHLSSLNIIPYASIFHTYENIEQDPLPIQQSVSEPPPSLTAKSAIIYNPINNEVLFEKHANTAFGIASITKIMTGLIAIERVGTTEIITVSKDAVLTEGAEGNLSIGEHLTLADLIAIMMTESSNDAAVTIAEYIGTLYGAESFHESQNIFVRMMNTKAAEIDLQSTQFQNVTGLDIDEDSGLLSNTSSAYDIAKLIAYSLRYPLLWNANTLQNTVMSQEGIVHEISTTHTILATEASIVSGKTGFTDTAGGGVATIAEIPLGKLSIIVVLSSTRDERFSDTHKLLNWLRL
jgi:serine-type D-Ala-D-Ala carboxypeptidase (penicillin-binding protein 5/6)